MLMRRELGYNKKKGNLQFNSGKVQDKAQVQYTLTLNVANRPCVGVERNAMR